MIMERIKQGLSRSESMGVGGIMGRSKSAHPPPGSSSSPHSSETKGRLSEGRSACILLLDERRLEMTIKPRLYAGELLDLVSSHCGLREKEYFGLAIVDENGLYTWLTLDRKVLDHDLPRKPSSVTIHFLVKFFIESISHLADNKTVELFYLQARSLVFRGTLEVESDIVFQLAALGLQASYSDYADDASTRSLIKKCPILPANVLKDHSSLTYCEDRVIDHYKKTKGQTRGEALVNYMTIVESMPTYGVHYFEVYDKRQKPWWLGLSCKGIAQYSFEDRRIPVRVFQWKRLENLYFRDKKFSIEVHDAKRVIQTSSSANLYEDSLRLEESSLRDSELIDAMNDSTTRVSTSRRSFNPGSIHVYVWFGKTQGLTKCIWQSAISQHQFYLDRKQAKLRHHVPPRTLNEIARDLTRSSVSLSSASSLSNLSRHSSASSHSLVCGASGGKRTYDDDVAEGGEDAANEETRRARMEMLAALRARREALDSKLREKTKLLKELCIKEGELTGELPPETPLNPGENFPIIRRRVGTEFELNFERLLNMTSVTSPQEELLSNLELEREIQSQITNAALKISNDTSVSKSVRKQRKISYQQSQRKLKEIENKLADLKLRISSKNKKIDNKSELRRRLSVPDLERCGSESSLEEDNHTDEVDSHVPISPRSCPTSPRKHPGLGRSSDSVSLEAASSSPQRLHRTRGYVPNSLYLRSSYRVKQYPTLSSEGDSLRTPRHHHYHHMPVPTPEMVLGSSTRSATLPSSPYRNKFEVNSQCDSPVGLYNCPQQRTSQAFSSLDDIDALHQQQQQQQNCSQQPSPGTRRLEAAAGNYPSLERSARKKFSRNDSILPPRHQHPPPPPPPVPLKETRRSMEDLSTLEASGVHGRSKMRYKEINGEIRSTDEYPRWSSPRDGGGPYPLPPTVNRTTLLPGQTYPDPQPANGPLNISLVNNNNSIHDVLLKEDTSEEEPPPLYPKQYYQRRRSGLADQTVESPAVNRKVKPALPSSSPLGGMGANTSFETVIPGDHRGKYVPFRETTKPFEMSDYYKYSTKFRKVSASSIKSGESGGESSDRSSTTSAGSNQPPPELPARSTVPPSIPSTPLVQTATVTPTKSKLTAQNSDSSLGDAFSSEMLAWYNNQKPSGGGGTTASSSSSSNNNNNNNNKPATLV